MAKKPKMVGKQFTKAEAKAKFEEHNQQETVADPLVDGGVKAAPPEDGMGCGCEACEEYRSGQTSDATA